MIEFMWMFHDWVVNFRPFFYISGSCLTLLILVLMLWDGINDDE